MSIYTDLRCGGRSCVFPVEVTVVILISLQQVCWDKVELDEVLHIRVRGLVIIVCGTVPNNETTESYGLILLSFELELLVMLVNLVCKIGGIDSTITNSTSVEAVVPQFWPALIE